MNDKTQKSLEAYPLTSDDIRRCDEGKWYQGSCYNDTIAPPKISSEMRERIVATLGKLFDAECLRGLGTFKGVPHVQIIPKGQQWPRLVIFFDADRTELRRNNRLQVRHREELIGSWAADTNMSESLFRLVSETITKASIA